MYPCAGTSCAESLSWGRCSQPWFVQGAWCQVTGKEKPPLGPHGLSVTANRMFEVLKVIEDQSLRSCRCRIFDTKWMVSSDTQECTAGIIANACQTFEMHNPGVRTKRWTLGNHPADYNEPDANSTGYFPPLSPVSLHMYLACKLHI